MLATIAVLVGANTVTPTGAAFAAPDELVYSMSTNGLPYDSGKARKAYVDNFGSNRIEDLAGWYAGGGGVGVPGGFIPFDHAVIGSTWASTIVASGAKGTVTFEPYAVTIRVTTSSIKAQAFSDVLKAAAVIAATTAATATSFFFCFAAATELTPPVAAILCKAVSGSIAALVARVMWGYFSGADMRSGAFWADTIGYMLAGRSRPVCSRRPASSRRSMGRKCSGTWVMPTTASWTGSAAGQVRGCATRSSG